MTPAELGARLAQLAIDLGHDPGTITNMEVDTKRRLLVVTHLPDKGNRHATWVTTHPWVIQP